ncbi:PREDICTED: uncharacterized protein LOC106751224 [Dinoponera quadriceps]|uniref:Uncharacterized protein LOC106751224 n=1 Tax=Dinoponera quadriceps TaxID=609295 RepID=A0A6P3YC61_DINQU|nr:PREDICTED: uncharacterized protein LOC106751224 [Dinoponera quadriceps]
MKTLIIIISVLAITVKIYGLNIERLRRFYDSITKCSQELGIPLTEGHADVVLCAIIKDGQVFDENGAFVKEATFKALEDGISDTNKLEQAKQIFEKCYDDANQKDLTSEERKKEINSCSYSTVSFFDKLS